MFIVFVWYAILYVLHGITYFFWGDNDELFAHASITFKRFSRVIMDLYGVNNVAEKSLVDDKIFYIVYVPTIVRIYILFLTHIYSQGCV